MTKLTRSGQAVVLTLAGLASAPRSVAQEMPSPAPNTTTRQVRNSFGGSLGPLGLQDTVEVSWRRSLFGSTNRLLEGAHLAFGLSHRITPAYDRVGGWFQVAPLSVLEVRAGVEPSLYFGTFKSLLYFSEYSASFDDDARKARADEAAFGLAGRAYVAPTLKAKVGSVLVRSRAEFEWWRARDKGPFFYEPSRDTLLRSSGDVLVTTETVLLYEISRGGKKLLLGPVHDLTWVYDAPQNRKQDVGLVGIWSAGGKRFGVREPALSAKVFYYVEHPFRKHQVGAQLALGFGFGPSAGSR